MFFSICHDANISSSSRTRNQYQKQDHYNEKHKSHELTNRHHHQHLRRRRTLSDSDRSTNTARDTTRASSSTSRLSRFDGFSTIAVCDCSKFRRRISSLNQLQRHHQTSHESSRFEFDGLLTRAVHGSRSNIKPQVRLQQHRQKSLPSLIDGLTTRAVHGSRSGNIKPPLVRQQPGLFMVDNHLSTKAVHGPRSGKIKLPDWLQQHHGIQSSRFDSHSTKAVQGSRSGRI
ncbi:hypothetical protein LWI28_016608 [Acer negundo]|uniref:Uncharacterized protein n=1 Tax=Acer negundo TaxID=4023 RepID=A0AAD5NVY0_ACENE|nr:hypothetical protein LWI28_016608 [Acer negundo]